MKMYFLRHGETDGNKEKILQGRIDNPLNENGKSQAMNARNEIDEIVFDDVYTSPLRRAVETAMIASGHEEEEIIKDERLVEISFGDMEGRVVSKDNEKMVNFFMHPELYEVVDNGESYESLLDRIGEFLNEMRYKYKDNPDANILVVSHGALIHGIILLIKKLELKDFWVANVANCAITIAEYDGTDYHIIRECDRVDRNYVQEN